MKFWDSWNMLFRFNLTLDGQNRLDPWEAIFLPTETNTACAVQKWPKYLLTSTLRASSPAKEMWLWTGKPRSHSASKAWTTARSSFSRQSALGDGVTLTHRSDTCSQTSFQFSLFLNIKLCPLVYWLKQEGIIWKSHLKIQVSKLFILSLPSPAFPLPQYVPVFMVVCMCKSSHPPCGCQRSARTAFAYHSPP